VRKFTLFICVVAVAVAIGCGSKTGSGSENDPGKRAVPVTVSRAVMRTTTLRMKTTGDIRAFAKASIVSEVAGTIEKLRVERGEPIASGDVIAVVEHAEASAAVRQAEAALQAAKAQVIQVEATLKNLRIEFDRIVELFDAGATSKQALDGIESNRDVANASREVAIAQVAQAEAALEQARVSLANHFIHAPISGVITKRYVDEGDKNNPNEPIITIAQMDTVKVMCDFPERDLPLLRVGQNARLEVDAYTGEEFPAEISIISPVVDPVARTVAVELVASNAEGHLRPGMFARVTVIGDEVEMLAVPGDAVTSIPGTGAQFVFVIDGDHARRVDVKVGVRAEGWTEISGDVQPGDMVVVEGQGNLKSGSRVRIDSEVESET